MKVHGFKFFFTVVLILHECFLLFKWFLIFILSAEIFLLSSPIFLCRWFQHFIIKHAILHACDRGIGSSPSEEKCHEVKESMTMFGPSDQCPLRGKGGAEGTKGGAFPTAVRPVCLFFASEARFYGFLNDSGIP